MFSMTMDGTLDNNLDKCGFKVAEECRDSIVANMENTFIAILVAMAAFPLCCAKRDEIDLCCR